MPPKGQKLALRGGKLFFFLMNKAQICIDLHKQIAYLWNLNFMKGVKLWKGCLKRLLKW